MPNAFRILKPIQKSSKRVWVFRNTGANAFAKKQMRLAYEDKRDLYCIMLQLISEQYMVELHSPPGRYTIILYLADYVNTLNPIWFTLDNNTNPSGFSHIYTRKVLLSHIIHYHHDPTYSSLCIETFTWLRFMIYTHSLDYTITSEHTEIPAQTARLETRVPGGASSIPREQLTRLLWQPTSRHIYSGPEGHTDTNNKAGNRKYQGMSH